MVAFILLGKYLARIEDAVGIEQCLYAFHPLQAPPVFGLHVFALSDADTVLEIPLAAKSSGVTHQVPPAPALTRFGPGE